MEYFDGKSKVAKSLSLLWIFQAMKEVSLRWNWLACVMDW